MVLRPCPSGAGGAAWPRDPARKGAIIRRVISLLAGVMLSVAALAGPETAGADGLTVALAPGDSVMLVGQGAGHGVGMSQWGARGRALAGQSAAEILAVYYPGSVPAVQGDDTEKVRIKLRSGAVQALPMGDYLASVVSSELPPGFPSAAVQAQAIASRSYALWLLDPSKPYDVTSTVSTQAFGAPARPDALAAVGATRGQVLTDGSHVIPAYFVDCGLGRTENNEDIWPGPALPYLRGIDDRDGAGRPYDAGCPREHWQAGPFTTEALSALLAADPRTDVGALTALSFGGRSPGGRWESVTLEGAAGTKWVTLSVFRAVMNAAAPAGRTVYSANFAVVPVQAAPSRSALENGMPLIPALRNFTSVLS